MNKNDTTEYINIQNGGIKTVTQAATRLVQGVSFSSCPGEEINAYLDLPKNPKPVPVQQLYDHFISTKNRITEEKIKEISDQINNSLARQYEINVHIHNFLDDESKAELIPAQLDFSSDKNGYFAYSTLCNLYQDYSSYIKLTNEINQLLCQMSISSNYFLKKGYLSITLESDNPRLITSLNNLRQGQPVSEEITGFIRTNYKYIQILNRIVPNIEVLTPFEIYNYLIGVAKKFKEEIGQLVRTQTLLDKYINDINTYYETICDSNILGIQTSEQKLISSDFENLFLGVDNNIINEKFPHLFSTIQQEISGSNKFFKLYNHALNYITNQDEDARIEEFGKLRNIVPVYKSLKLYNPDIKKDEFYSQLFVNQNQPINIFLNDSLRDIFDYNKLPTNNLVFLSTQIQQDGIKNFFNKELIDLQYKTYLDNFKLPPESNVYTNPNYHIFNVSQNKYSRFIENLTNHKLTAPDLSKDINKFINYVNVFRPQASQVNQDYLTGLFISLYIQDVTVQQQEQINEYVLYNKSLNNKINPGINVSFYNIITYPTLLEILNKIELVYLNKFASPEFEPLKTNIDLSFSLIPKNLINRCVVDKTINKDKISGIKLLIHIVDCQDNQDSEKKNKLIHFYLTLNTQEINSSRLISLKKIKSIFQSLKEGVCTPKQIETLIKVIKLKKIIDPFLQTELNLLESNTTNIDTQKSMYYLLSTLAPEKIDWNIMVLLQKYAWENLMPGVSDIIRMASNAAAGAAFGFVKNLVRGKKQEPKEEPKEEPKKATKEIISISGFKNYVFEKISVENFIKDEPRNPNPQYKFICFKIYSYFNFDSVIVSMDTIQKIIRQLEKNEYNKKIFNILKKIILRNSKNLEQINKSSSPKLDYFLQTKWSKLQEDQYYISQLYDILKDVTDENLFPVNILDFLKDKGIDVLYSDEVKGDKFNYSEEDQQNLKDLYLQRESITPQDLEKINYQIAKLEEEYLPIYKMFEVFLDYNISANKELIIGAIDSMKHGICEDNSNCSTNTIIELINQSGPFISSNEQIKIFFATGKDANQDYASEQELYYILENLSKSSALIKNITAKVTEVATDSITSAINSKLQATALEMGFTEVPIDAISKAKEIVQTAKTIAVTAGVGFATVGAYYAVDKLFGSSSESESSSLVAYEESDFKSKLKLFIGSVGTGLTLYSAKSLFPGISSLVKDYIGWKSTALGLPLPLISTTIIGSIIMGGITRYLSGLQEGGDNTSNQSKSLIEKILEWVFDAIDKLYGFNGKKPEPIDQTNQNKSYKNIESIYIHLTSQKLGSDDIFDSAIINEHPDQTLILNELRKKYREFSKMSLDSNPYVQLTKQDKKKIKKIIGKIVALELNLFKGNEPYTFVNAISKFLNE
jgi:hypothetical protein